MAAMLKKGIFRHTSFISLKVKAGVVRKAFIP